MNFAARCCECALRLDVVEPFTDGVCQQVRCDGCRVYLHVRRTAQGWTVCTATDAKQQRTAPLPAIGPRRRRYSLHRVLRTVLRVLTPGEGLSPGESSFPQLAPPVAQAVGPQARPVEVSSAVVHDRSPVELAGRDNYRDSAFANTGADAPQVPV